MASVVYGVASKLQAIANDVLPASMVQQAQSLDAFIETSYGVQYGTVLIVLVLVVLAIPLLLAPLFSGGPYFFEQTQYECRSMIFLFSRQSPNPKQRKKLYSDDRSIRCWQNSHVSSAAWWAKRGDCHINETRRATLPEHSRSN